ncbi:MAG: hypothetical protein DSM106950_04530 [Stigonema ocellatum SAG 48.90 = DSM 106950]|nr:hypothetical protein [Stigonema ocellatum SAG 48.90 = DSM 106950]
MNSQPEEDLQHRRPQLEAEIHSSESGVSTFNLLIAGISSRFNRLSGIGKAVVLGVAVLFGFGILQAVFKLIVSVISLALLALVVYLGYKFIVSSRSQSN